MFPSLPRHALAAGLLCSSLVAPLAAEAGPLRVSSSGTFSATTPTTFFSAPGASWSLSFVIDAQPVPIVTPAGITESGQFTTVPFSDFVFTVNGVTIAEVANTISFYNSVGNSGGVDIFFTDAVADPAAGVDAMTFYGPQLYTGDEFTPTFSPGSFTTFYPGLSGVAAAVGGVLYWGNDPVTLVVSAVPAPASWALAALALGLVGATQRRRSEPVAAVAG